MYIVAIVAARQVLAADDRDVAVRHQEGIGYSHRSPARYRLRLRRRRVRGGDFQLMTHAFSTKACCSSRRKRASRHGGEQDMGDMGA